MRISTGVSDVASCGTQLNIFSKRDAEVSAQSRSSVRDRGWLLAGVTDDYDGDARTMLGV